MVLQLVDRVERSFFELILYLHLLGRGLLFLSFSFLFHFNNYKMDN